MVHCVYFAANRSQKKTSVRDCGYICEKKEQPAWQNCLISAAQSKRKCQRGEGSLEKEKGKRRRKGEIGVILEFMYGRFWLFFGMLVEGWLVLVRLIWVQNGNEAGDRYRSRGSRRRGRGRGGLTQEKYEPPLLLDFLVLTGFLYFYFQF